MKKLLNLAAVFVLAIFLGAVSVAEAVENVNITKGADMTGITRLAIAMPLYSPGEKEPTKEEFLEILTEASRVSKCFIISYEDITNNIRRDTGVDIKFLERHKAAKAYTENVGKYAEAYVMPTVSLPVDKKKSVMMFFGVYDAKTHAMLFDYQVRAGHTESRNAETYKSLCESFYRRFDKTIETQQKQKLDGTLNNEVVFEDSIKTEIIGKDENDEE